MREIKFRGKRFDSGQWVRGTPVRSFPSNPQFDGIIEDGVSDFPPRPIDPATLGEYTGLRDINGKEIYEGDIIKTDFDSENFIVVRFVRGVFAFLWNDNLDDELPTSAPTQEWAIVVGNIHDNPELY